MKRSRVVGPLTLARLLRPHVPLISDLVHQICSYDAERLFRDLILRFVPEERDAILHAGAGRRRNAYDGEAARCYEFAQAFQARYFPINEVDEMEYLLYGIPVPLMGWEYDDWHYLELRPGDLMLLSLVEEPYREEFMTGVHTVLKETLESTVGQATLQRMPPPMNPERLHALLDDSAYKPAAEFADWVWGTTGTAFLDYTTEMEIQAEWEEDVVQALVRQWHEADGILARTKSLSEWLEAAPRKHFAMLVDAVLEALSYNPPLPKVGDRPLFEIFAEELDLVTQESDPDPAGAGGRQLAVSASAAD